VIIYFFQISWARFTLVTSPWVDSNKYSRRVSPARCNCSSHKK